MVNFDLEMVMKDRSTGDTIQRRYLDRIAGPQLGEFYLQEFTQVFCDGIEVLVGYYPYRYLRFYPGRNHGWVYSSSAPLSMSQER